MTNRRPYPALCSQPTARRCRRPLATLAVLLLCIGAGSATAQIAIQLDLDREHYVLYEPINATIQLRNYSGNTLVFGSEEAEDDVGGFLKFRVIRGGDLAAPRTQNNDNPVENLILGPGETKGITLAVNSIVNMGREGTYTIQVRIGHPRLSHDYLSNSLQIDVMEGLPVWTRTIGVPQQSETATIPPRQVSLLRFRTQNGETYVLRVEDKRIVYGIVRLGPYLSSSRPQCRIDAMSNIHLLYQIHPRLYVYRIYDVDVDLKQNLYYVMKETVPRLTRDPDVGSIRIVGGRRAKPGEDYRIGPEMGADDLPQAINPGQEESDDGTLDDPRGPTPRLPRSTIPEAPESSTIPGGS